MKLKTLPLSQIKRGQRILVRIDANVALKNGRLVGGAAWRLQQVVGTLRDLSKRGAIVIVCSHLGRPNGKVVRSLSMKPVAQWFRRTGKLRATLAPGIVGSRVAAIIAKAQPGDVVVLENVRFDAREEKDDATFAKALASFADVYINDALGMSHRKHASVHAITKELPSYAGPLVAREVKALSIKRKKPFVLVMGGAKLATKMPVLEKLAPEAGAILTGGTVALVLQAARDGRRLTVSGKPIGRTDLALAKRALDRFGDKIVLPVDLIIDEGDRAHAVWADEIENRDRVIDIGPKTREYYAQFFKDAKTIIWNGTMGVIEERAAQGGTIAIASSIAKQRQAQTILGGGDTIGFLQQKKRTTGFTHLSTGGGAMLVFLAGAEMPGLAVLKN